MFGTPLELSGSSLDSILMARGGGSEILLLEDGNDVAEREGERYLEMKAEIEKLKQENEKLKQMLVGYNQVNNV